MQVCLVSAARIQHIETTSPLTLLVAAAVLIAAVAAAWKQRRRSMAVAITYALVIAAIGLAILYVSNRIPGGGYYGVWINGTKAYIRFWNDDMVEADLCKANISLVPVDKARDMLSIRVKGLGDPVTGVSMGYYRTRDGGEAFVLIVEGGEALVVRGRGWVAIVAVPGVEECYRAALAAQTGCTRK